MSEIKRNFNLDVVDGKLCLISKQQDNKFSPIFIDLVAGEMSYKAKHSYGSKDLFAKAIGLKSKPQTALDLTAGFLTDTHHLLHLGLEVTCVEKNPLIAAMIKDGVQRAQQSAPIYQHLKFFEMDCQDFLASNDEVFDVVLFDPMFPVKKKQALPSKYMQVLHELVPPVSDEINLAIAQEALQHTNKRLVVKRPLQARVILPNPNLSFKGKAIRYDVYLP